MDHHPDLDIRYTKISATLSTHSSGGITGNDVALAREMEKLAAQ
jgi:4a-hydroxytetrahydrobiopterin dehydratase